VTGFAGRARQRTRQAAPRTPERRAAAALYTALTTTKTADAARRTFGDPVNRAAAIALLDQLEREETR